MDPESFNHDKIEKVSQIIIAKKDARLFALDDDDTKSAKLLTITTRAQE